MMKRTLPLVAALFAIASLAACETFTGPKTLDCRWRYTKLVLRTDTIWNTEGPGYLLVTHKVPTDSVQECRPRA